MNIAYTCRPTLQVFLYQTFYPEINDLNRNQLRMLKREILLALFHLRNKRDFKSNLERAGISEGENKKISKSIWIQLLSSYEMNAIYKMEVIKWLHDEPCFDDESDLCRESKGELSRLLSRGDISKMKKQVEESWKESGQNTNRLQISREQIKEIEDEVLKDPKIKSKANWLAYRKLKFVSDHNNFDAWDWKQDFSGKIVQVLRWEYPFKSKAHLTNSCKVAIHNFAMNTISYYRFGKRSRLVEDEFGWAQTELDIEDPSIQELKECSYSSQGDVEFGLAIEQMKQSSSYEERAAINLLVCHSHPVFEKWLHRRYGYKKVKNLDELQNKLGPIEYANAVRQYLGLTGSNFKGLMCKIQQGMAVPQQRLAA